MEQGFFGVPWLLWSGLALLVAGFFLWFWPRHRAAQVEPGPRRWILRWGHATVWLLLAASFAIRALSEDVELASRAGNMALAVYIVFIVTFIRSKSS